MSFEKAAQSTPTKIQSVTESNAHALPVGSTAPAEEQERRGLGHLLPPPTTLMVVDDRLVTDARMAAGNLYERFGNVTDVSVSAAQFMLSQNSGSVQTLKEFEALTGLAIPPETVFDNAVFACGPRANFSFCGNEGQQVLQPIVKDAMGGWVTLAQPSDSSSSEYLIAGTCRIPATAEKAAAHVLLVIVCPAKARAPDIRDFCHEYLEVEACAPDPGAQLAFSVEALQIGERHSIGYGKVICNICLTGDGYVRKFEPFIAKFLRDRFIWNLRGSGKSLADIGALVGLHKSTVQDRLDQMRPVRRQAMSDELIAQYVEALEIDDVGKHSPDHPDESDALV